MRLRPGGRLRRSVFGDRTARDGGLSMAGTTIGPPLSPPRSVADEASAARDAQLRELRRSRTFVTGATIVAFWVLCAAFGALIAPHDPLATDPRNALAAP